MTPRIVFDLIQAWENMPHNTGTPEQRRKASFANSVQWYSEYADGREAPHGIVAANWNDADYYDAESKTRVTYPERIESRLCAIFEKLGVEIEWSDQVSSCGDCDKCIQTEPDCYGWQPAFIVTDGDIFCSACAENEAESLLENAEGGIWNMPDIDPTEHGYVALPEEYQTGWHPGQTDDPKKVLRILAKEKGITRALVVIKDVGQFDSRWQVYVHADEV
jgi:hypothetical protein